MENESVEHNEYCLFCGKLLVGTKKFCNRKCSNSHHHNRFGTGKGLGVCKCGKPLHERHSKFCSRECFLKESQDLYIVDWLAGKESGERKPDGISNKVRRWLMQRAENKCEATLDDGTRCGWARINSKTGKTPLTIHHKDGDAKNNRPENLQVICPCCHALTSNYGSLNNGHGRKCRKKNNGVVA